jgi:hypothetical protein
MQEKLKARNIWIMLYVSVLTLILIVDLALRLHDWRYNQDVRAFNKVFGLVKVYTNDATGFVIIDKKTSKPIWGEWSFSPPGRLDSVSYFFEGRNIMNIYPGSTEPPPFDITFFGGDGTVRAVWANRGTDAGFTERTQYGNGNPTKEIWFDEAWHALQYRTNDGTIQGGIVVDGSWRHVTFTNGTTAIEPR